MWCYFLGGLVHNNSPLMLYLTVLCGRERERGRERGREEEREGGRERGGGEVKGGRE